MKLNKKAHRLALSSSITGFTIRTAKDKTEANKLIHKRAKRHRNGDYTTNGEKRKQIRYTSRVV